MYEQEDIVLIYAWPGENGLPRHTMVFFKDSSAWCSCAISHGVYRSRMS